MKKNALKGIACILALAVMMTYSFGFFTVPVQAKKDTGVKAVKITNVKSKKITIGKGKKVKLSIALVLKKGSKASKKVTFKSSKSAVASVSKTGVIKAKKLGKTKITVKSKANPKKKVTITVVVAKKNILVKKISMRKKLTLYMDTSSDEDEDDSDEDEDDAVLYEDADNTYQLDYKVTPSNATNQKVKWSSSNKKVITVDANGTVTMVGTGKAKVTVKTTDGSKEKAVCVITVKPDED